MQRVHIYAMIDKPRRHQQILDLVQRGGVTSQEQLSGMLQRIGISVTQATLSRDLRELGVVKGPAGYMLPGDVPMHGSLNGNGELGRALKEFLVKGDLGGNLAVLHTGPGRAQLLALEIDRHRPKGVLGTVAGDDTIFVALRTPHEASRLLKEFKHLAGIR
jgi:transcriptional regulator of arginine metabolism